MLPEQYHWMLREFEPEGDPWLLFAIARELEQADNLEGAATHLRPRLTASTPTRRTSARAAQVLDRLAVVEHGLVFRYVPGGSS